MKSLALPGSAGFKGAALRQYARASLPSADVVAEVPSEVLKLTAERLARLEQEHPRVAMQFHRFLIQTLSSRLASSTEEVRALV